MLDSCLQPFELGFAIASEILFDIASVFFFFSVAHPYIDEPLKPESMSDREC